MRRNHLFLLLLATFLIVREASSQTLPQADSCRVAHDRALSEARYTDAFIDAVNELALRFRGQGPHHPETGASWIRLASIQHRAGFYDQAAETYRTGLDILHRTLPPTHAWSLAARSGRASLLKDLGHLEQARDEQREVVRLTAEGHGEAAEVHASAVLALGHVHRRLQEHHAADSLLTRGVTEIHELFGSASYQYGDACTWTGWYFWKSDRPDRARGLLWSAVEAYSAAFGPTHPRVRVPLTYLSRIARAEGDIARAESLWTAIAPDAVPDVPIGMNLIRVGSATRMTTELLLNQDRPGEAFDVLLRGYGWMHRLFLYLGETDATPAGRALRELENTVLDLERRAEAGDDARIRRFCAEADRIRATRDRGLNASVVTLEELQSTLASNMALVGWFCTNPMMERRSAVWAYVVRPTGPVVWVPLMDEQREWWNPMKKLRESLFRDSRWPTRLPRSAELDGLARAGWDRLVEPVLPHLTAVERLVLITNQWEPSARVPAECLLDSDGRFLIDRFAVTYAGSPGEFVVLRTRPRPPRSGRALVLGDPWFQPQERVEPVALLIDLDRPSLSVVEPPLLRSALDGHSLRDLPRLPYSGLEARSVAACYPGADLLLGQGATEQSLDAFRRPGVRWDVVHWATHSLVHPDNLPARSALALASDGEPEFDGLLTARELYSGWSLDADLVTLSGCQTAGARMGAGSELLGLPLALARAGARSVLASSWKVDDIATAHLMNRFYENRTGSYPDRRGPEAPGTPMTKDRSLREAKRWLRDLAVEGRQPFAHPVYWAGFALSGDPD